MVCIQAQTGLFIKFGGHKMAAGFSCKSSDTTKLIQAIEEHFRQRLADNNLCKQIYIDTALRLHELDKTFIQRINKLAPYGIENPQPLFVSGPLQVERMKLLGNNGKHLKLYLSEPLHDPKKKIYEAVLWNRAEEFLNHYTLYSKPELSIVYSAKLSEYMGEIALQLEIKDWQKPSLVASNFFARFAKTTLAA
jgi:single-stranded-DNA-specific exonuclease